MQANQEIRETARSAGVRLWKVAEMMNIRDNELSRKLRHELPNPEKEKIMAIIEKLRG